MACPELVEGPPPDFAQTATAYAESAEDMRHRSTAESLLAALRSFFKDNPTWK